MTPAKGQASGAISLSEAGVTFDNAAGYFLSDEEKEAIIKSEARFYINDIAYETEQRYGSRFLLTIVPVDDPAELPRGWQFSANEENEKTHKPQPGVIARNASLRALMDIQTQAGGRPVGPVRFVQRGQFRTIEEA